MVPKENQSFKLESLLKEAYLSFSAKEPETCFEKPFPLALEVIHNANNFEILLSLNALTLKVKNAIRQDISDALVLCEPKILLSSFSRLAFLKKVHCVIKEQSLFPSPLFPEGGFEAEDVATRILSHLNPQYNVFRQSIPAGLNALACVSKSWNMKVQRFYQEHLEQHVSVAAQAHSLLKCKTFKEAMQLILEEKLAVANLEKFNAITIDQVDLLLKRCPQVKHLIVSSNCLQALPKSCCQLQTLECRDCQALTHLPDGLTELTSLKCIDCPALTSLPDSLTQLSHLICCSCKNLKSLPPGLNDLSYLSCVQCPNLTSLPNHLANLVTLNCRYCLSLVSLPSSLTKLKHLDCSGCSQLETLPECLTQLTKLDCNNCSQLKSLPVCLTQLKSLDCSYCIQIKSLPSCLTQLAILECSYCKNLLSLPNNMLQLQHVCYRDCPLLKIQNENYPQVTKSCDECLLM